MIIDTDTLREDIETEMETRRDDIRSKFPPSGLLLSIKRLDATEAQLKELVNNLEYICIKFS